MESIYGWLLGQIKTTRLLEAVLLIMLVLSLVIIQQQRAYVASLQKSHSSQIDRLENLLETRREQYDEIRTEIYNRRVELAELRVRLEYLQKKSDRLEEIESR